MKRLNARLDTDQITINQSKTLKIEVIFQIEEILTWMRCDKKNHIKIQERRVEKLKQYLEKAEDLWIYTWIFRNRLNNILD